MVDTIPTYEDAEREGVLLLGLTSTNMFRITNTAHVHIDLVNDFDKQRHKHQNFGRKKFLGISFAKITVDFVIMPDEEADFWEHSVPLFRQRGKQGASPALQCFNYQINRAGATTVNVLKARIGPPSSKSGRAVTLELEEWAIGPAAPKPSDSPQEKFDPSPGGLIDKSLAKGAARNNT
jgi:hypothetical protein